MPNVKPATNDVAVSIVIPAFNEELGIEAVVKDLSSAFKNIGLEAPGNLEIIVVDDGSADGTAALAEKSGARVVRQPINRGYGRALLTGIDRAKFDWILIIDADGSYSADDAAKLVCDAPQFDMVIGARQGSLFWGSPLKAFLRWIYLFLASFIAGEKIPDANSGLRLIRKSALGQSMPILCYGFSLTTTMTLSFLSSGRFVKFVPVAYLNRKGSSKVRGLRDIPRTLQIMTQVILFYNPLKFFVVLAALPLALGVGFGACAYLGGRPVWTPVALSCLCFLSSLFVFIAGCLLEGSRIQKSR